jgi:hypothetical protein
MSVCDLSHTSHYFIFYFYLFFNTLQSHGSTFQKVVKKYEFNLSLGLDQIVYFWAERLRTVKLWNLIYMEAGAGFIHLQTDIDAYRLLILKSLSHIIEKTKTKRKKKKKKRKKKNLKKGKTKS